jgi:hypothetical protein
MEGVRNTEEMSKMKISLLALAFGFFLCAGTAYAGPTPGGADTDGDGLENAFDNCTVVSNTNQIDTDHNGCGDACTQNIQCDFNADKAVGAPDLVTVSSNFGMVGVPIGTLGDCAVGAGDGVVGAPDLIKVSSTFLNMVGPSGITTAQCDTSSCICTPQ